MKWLEKEIIIDTISINIAALIFSILSLSCCIITILIYVKVKSLRTIIYRLFFHISINEVISRVAHIFQFINSTFLGSNNIIFDINIVLIYLTDTNILIFIAFSCYAMFELILKQNKNINNQFSKIVKFILGFSIILTSIFFIISISNEENEKEKNKEIDLYRNIIALNFIKDTDKRKKELYPLLITSIIYLILVIYSFFKTCRIHYFIGSKGDINEGDEDDNQKEKKIQKSLKLQSFKNKMLQYPLLGVYFFLPLMVYSYIEFFKPEEQTLETSENLDYLRARYIFFNIYCFMNSTRGWMFFRVFISNEKIKIYLFKNYLTSSIFYSIDKISLKRERNFTISSIGSLQSNRSSDSSLLLENNNKKNNIIDNNEKNEDEEKLLELNNNDRPRDDFNLNNLDEENAINPDFSHDSKSETLKIKSHI